MKPRWSDAELAIVRDHYAEGVDACVALLPGRCRAAIWRVAGRLGLTNLHRRWTAAEDAALLVAAKAGPIPQLPGRTPHACKLRALRIGISRRILKREQRIAGVADWKKFLGVRA
jgi:hypothetical protein